MIFKTQNDKTIIIGYLLLMSHELYGKNLRNYECSMHYAHTWPCSSTVKHNVIHFIHWNHESVDCSPVFWPVISNFNLGWINDPRMKW